MNCCPIIVAMPLLLSPLVTRADQSLVEMKGLHPKQKLEHVVAGHLTELNGRYKLRASEVTFEPGGFVGPHHHAGPGVRCITAGQLTYTESGKTTEHGVGDCFFESGDVTHTARNNTTSPVTMLNFELLPVAHEGPSAIPVPK